MHKLITVFIISYIAVVASFAQNYTPTVIASSGDFYYDTQGYGISYTLGEVFIQQPPTFPNRDFFCEGFQQGIWLSEIPPPQQVRVYPNPIGRNDNNLKVDLPVRGETNSYYISIFTMNGQVVYNKKHSNTFINDPLLIPFRNYRKALYLVKIQSDKGDFLKTFKIEKL